MHERMFEATVDQVMAGWDHLMRSPRQHTASCDVASHRRELADDFDELE